MRIGFLVAAVVILMWGGPSCAELSAPVRAWIEGPERFLATPAERKAFSRIATDGDAEAFVALFWARRDPDLTTKPNEFRREFEGRVARADRDYSYSETRGALSDRGKILILLGSPDRISEPDSTLQVPGESQGPSKGRPQIWTYSQVRLPRSFHEDVSIYLVESARGRNDYQIVTGDPRNFNGMRLVGGAAERLLLHPDLKAVPKVGLVSGSRSATQEELRALAAAPREWPQGSRALAVQGVEGEAGFPLWVAVSGVPALAGAELLIGRVTQTGGVGSEGFALPVGSAVRSSGILELSLALAPGHWTIELGLVSGGATTAATTVETEVREVSADGPFVSPLYWSLEADQQEVSRFGPFVVGSWHLIQPASDECRPEASIKVFAFVVRPPLDATGRPRALSIKATILKGSGQVDSFTGGSIVPDRLSGDIWVCACQIKAPSQPGAYVLDVQLVQASAGLTSKAKVPIKVGDPAATS